MFNITYKKEQIINLYKKNSLGGFPLKHSVLCNECEVTHLNVHAKFPSNSPMYSREKEKLSSLVENSNSDKVQEVCYKLKPNLKRLLNESLSDLHDKYGKPKKVSKKDLKNLSLEISKVLDDSYQENSKNCISFYESYTKSKQLEPKKNYKEKRTTQRHMFKKVVNRIQDSNCVNRLYGADVSLRGWDLERKRKSFETVEDAHKRSAEENTKIASGKKKEKRSHRQFCFL